MTYSLKPLGRAHVKDVEALWRVDVEDEGATSPPGIALLDPPDEHYEDAAITGAFAAGRLVAAMKWGRRRADAPGADFDNLHPGDGVVFWLFFTDPAGADALLARARTSGAARIYAFPEGGDLARLTLFETGMLSLRRKRAVNYFERSGFVVPAGDAWGPQERIGFRLAIPDRVDVPTLPPGFRIEVHTTERACRLLLLTESGERIGEANMGPARMNGLDVPRSFFLHWLGVDGAYRDRGFGRMLLLNQIEHARRLGATDLYLTTHSGRPAWKLYQRIGFTEVDRFRSDGLEVKRVDAAPSPRELCGEAPQLQGCATVDAAPSPRELCGETPQLRECACGLRRGAAATRMRNCGRGVFGACGLRRGAAATGMRDCGRGALAACTLRRGAAATGMRNRGRGALAACTLRRDAAAT